MRTTAGGPGTDGSLRVRWGGRERSFAPGTVVRIGREPGSEVECSNPAVSRAHAVAEHRDGLWQVRDVGSSRGTWRDGRRVDVVDVRGTIQLSLGEEGSGESVAFESAAASARPGGSGPGLAAPTDLVAPGVRHAGTVIVGDDDGALGDGTVIGGPSRPGGVLRGGIDLDGTVVPDRTVTVSWDGTTRSFDPGADVTVGRGPDNAVTVDRPMVSRRHARLVFEGSSWHVEDLDSSGGTFVDGAAVTRSEIKGPTEVHLGEASSVAVLRVAPAGSAPPGPADRSSGTAASAGGRRTTALVVGALVVLLLVAGAVAVFVGRDTDPTPPSTEDLSRATVRIVNGDVVGSGTVIDAEEGLILTNAHVALPRAPGGAVTQRKFDVELPKGGDLVIETSERADAAVEPRFRGEVVASDGYLDIAVVRITRTIGGRLLEPGSPELGSLTEVEVGDSDDLTTGSEIRVFGFPTASNSRSVTLTEGVVSSAVQDERIGDSRAMLNYSAGTLPGNSGGGVYDERGRLVGVPTLLWEGKVASMRPINFAADLLDAARKGEDVQSSYIRPRTGEEVDASVRFVRPGRTSAGTSFSCGGSTLSLGDPVVGVELDYSGFEPGRHQDLLVAVFLGESEIGRWALGTEYPLEFPDSSGCMTVSVPVEWPDQPPDGAGVSALVGVGPEHATG